MSYKGFLGGVRVSRPSAANLRDPPLRMFLTASLSGKSHTGKFSGFYKGGGVKFFCQDQPQLQLSKGS